MLTPEEEESRGGRWHQGGGRRTEEDAGVEEYDAGHTMLEPEEDDGEGRWCLRRRQHWCPMRTTE